MRKPFQGVTNIIRFNWHMYLMAGLILFGLTLLNPYLPREIQPVLLLFALLAFISIVISLVISYYVYDLSNLYEFKWIPEIQNEPILNINAGFDETSDLIKRERPFCPLTICDFYDAQKHTEVSIKRARKAYPLKEGTIQVSTEQLPFQDQSFGLTMAILSLHEVRDENERVTFCKELNRVTRTGGKICVMEHLRDINNFIAYNIGAFHFHSKATWLTTFEKAGLNVEKELKITPFISTFILTRNGNTVEDHR